MKMKWKSINKKFNRIAKMKQIQKQSTNSRKQVYFKIKLCRFRDSLLISKNIFIKIARIPFQTTINQQITWEVMNYKRSEMNQGTISQQLWMLIMLRRVWRISWRAALKGLKRGHCQKRLNNCSNKKDWRKLVKKRRMNINDKWFLWKIRKIKDNQIKWASRYGNNNRNRPIESLSRSKILIFLKGRNNQIRLKNNKNWI